MKISFDQRLFRRMVQRPFQRIFLTKLLGSHASRGSKLQYTYSETGIGTIRSLGTFFFARTFFSCFLISCCRRRNFLIFSSWRLRNKRVKVEKKIRWRCRVRLIQIDKKENMWDTEVGDDERDKIEVNIKRREIRRRKWEKVWKGLDEG